jgi:hypothetical protein
VDLQPFDPVEVAANQTNVAVVVAAFAFAGFILLIDRSRQPPVGALQEPVDPKRFRETLFFLLAAFSIGVLAAFLYATSALATSAVEEPQQRGVWQTVVVAHGVFGLEVLAVAVGVFWLLIQWVDDETWPKLWLLGLLVFGWVAFRWAVALARLVESDSAMQGGQVWLVAIVGIVPVAATLAIVSHMPRAKSLQDATRRNVVWFVAALSVAAVLLAVVHTMLQLLDAGIRPLGSLITVAIALILGSLEAWAIVLVGPRRPPKEAPGGAAVAPAAPSSEQ